MKKQTQRIRQNETEEYISNEGIRQNPRRRTMQSGKMHLHKKRNQGYDHKYANKLRKRVIDYSEKFRKYKELDRDE